MLLANDDKTFVEHSFVILERNIQKKDKLLLKLILTCGTVNNIIEK